jgi:hypothetical protein
MLLSALMWPRLTPSDIQVFWKYSRSEYLNMTKAHIVTRQGSKITIEGTPEEVAMLVAKLGEETAHGRGKAAPPKRIPRSQEKQKTTPVNLISSLIDGGFFRKPKDLAAVKVAIEEMGHHYPITTLSPVLLRLVRRRELRRIKEKKRWLYTG